MDYLISFLEGTITFISPCLLPMLPIYISYFAGQEEGKSKPIVNSLGFVLGFSIVFTTLGALAGSIGSILVRYGRVLDMVAGSVIILFGLSYLGLFRISFFNRGMKPGGMDPGKGFLQSVLFGMAFSIGWTPCLGTFLGSALMLAASKGSAVKGIMMLASYSIGLGIPFILSAILIDSLKGAFDFIKRHYRTVEVVSGILLITLGIMMVTGYLGRLLSLMSF